jgi:hypothetical protein
MTELDTIAADFAPHIEDAIESAATVTVTRADGKTATGTLVRDETDPLRLKVRTGRRGRPFTLHTDDLTAIDFE